MDLLVVLFGLIVWLLFCWAVCRYADSKGLEGSNYFVLSVFLSPVIGYAFAISARPNPAGLGLRKCPECAEWIQLEAKRCRFCSSPILALPASSRVVLGNWKP